MGVHQIGVSACGKPRLEVRKLLSDRNRKGGQEALNLFPFKRSAERDEFAVPRCIQRSIPIKRIYKDGIFEVSGKFSKTWRFFDVNYR